MMKTGGVLKRDEQEHGSNGRKRRNNSTITATENEPPQSKATDKTYMIPRDTSRMEIGCAQAETRKTAKNKQNATRSSQTRKPKKKTKETREDERSLKSDLTGKRDV